METKRLVVLLDLAVVVLSGMLALAGCDGRVPPEQTTILQNTVAEGAGAPLQEIATPTSTQLPPTRTVAPVSTTTPPHPTAATASRAANSPTALSPDPLDDEGLEFLSADTLESLGRNGGIAGVNQKPSIKGGSSPGPVKGQTYKWEDGDRVLTAYLQDDLVIEKKKDGSPGGLVTADDGGANVVRSAEGQAKGNTLPVFRSVSGALMTLPGGVLLALSPEWREGDIDAFFSSNDIDADRVSELSYVANGFFIETEPGFPSLDLANKLSAQEGVEVSSPNWGREVVAK